MSPELEEFLGAEDLDDLLRARQRIASLDTGEASAVRSMLQRWEDPQAVSNLLFHPALIPEDIRLASLFRGLAERRVAYYVLAAVVGFQGIDAAGMAAEDRARVVDELLAVIRETRGILAQRASVSVQRFLAESDAPRVFALWAHPDDAAWHNLRAWLFRTFQALGTEPFAEAASRSGLSQEAQRRLVEDFTELVAKPSEGFDSRLCELFGYIPNLRDIRRDT
jgi:hypothetical protein